MPTPYPVQQGDCLSSIAAAHGFSTWKLIWDDASNAELKQKRKDPNVLYPGDILNLPDKDLKQESGGVDASHKFKLKAPPTSIKVRLLLDDKPRSGLKYELLVAGKTIKGSTDGGGYVKADIPPDAASAILTLTEGTAVERYELGLGTLDPADTESGLKQRLECLGYDISGEWKDAIRAFQAKETMTVTGVADDALRAKVKEKFGQ